MKKFFLSCIVSSVFLIQPVFAQVLLVDGDRGFNYEKDYEYALQMAGIPYTHWDIAKKGEPDLLDLEKHHVTLWITDGSRYAFSFNEAKVLAHYLQKKGKAIVMGYHSGEALREVWLDQAFFGFSYEGSTLDKKLLRKFTGTHLTFLAQTDYGTQEREGYKYFEIEGDFHDPFYGKSCGIKTSKTFWFGFDIKAIPDLFSQAQLLFDAVRGL